MQTVFVIEQGNLIIFFLLDCQSQFKAPHRQMQTNTSLLKEKRWITRCFLNLPLPLVLFQIDVNKYRICSM